MNKRYLLIALRNIFRHRTISFITIFGLSIGLACSMFIYLWISDELNTDRFHKNGDRLYRVEEDQEYSQGLFHVTVTPWPSGPVWKEKIPEIENACRMTNPGSLLFRRNDKVFYENQIVAVDSTFFSMFTFQLLVGNPNTVLKDPHSIVISDEMARKYFGNEDAIGKSIQVNNIEMFQVSGIMKKMPANSSIYADFLIPFDYMKHSSWYSEEWGNNSIVTYVMLDRKAKPAGVDPKLTQIVKEHNPQTTTRFSLFPFPNMHLYAYWGFGHAKGAIINVWIFSSIALLVLIIACINFMNLSTARSASRAKEIGLRKLNGAYRRNLISQFFGESMLQALVGMLIAYLIVAVLISPFNLLSGKTFRESDLLKPAFILSSLVITIFTGILAGSYPALVLSSFKPSNTLKAGLSGGSKGGLFRKTTVIIQFTISMVLILFTIVTYRQLKFMQGKSLGFEKQNLLYLQIRGDMKNSYQLIKEELTRDPSVLAVSASSNPPHEIGSNADNIWWEGKSPEVHALVSMCGVDFGWAEAMGVSMKSGRSLSKSYATDIPHDTVGNFLINEQLEKLMGTDNAVGMQLKFGDTRGQIVGVMKDFNYQSLHSKIEPLAVWIWQPQYWNFIYIRVKPGNLHESMANLESRWKQVMPLYPFDYHFVDQDLDKTYRSEERLGSLLKYFSILGILIACIGLFGLATYTVEQRTRELGLRKVLGATGSSIAILISGEFIRLLLIAALISIPISLWLLNTYLTSYGYHIQLNIWIFVIAILLTIFVAALAISYQLLTAISSNPAKSLKYE
jgi:putative ABC transport system permease protein